MNTSFSRILVPVDGSPQSLTAFRAANLLSSHFHSSLTAVHIEESKHSEAEIRSLIAGADKDATYEYMHKNGSVHKELLATAAKTDASLIVMGTHGVSGFVEFWMGSNAYKVVNSATCPVLTMREDRPINGFKTIVVPIDTSFESRQKVPYAVRIAEKFGSTIHLLGVSVDADKDAEQKVNGYVRQAAESIEAHNIGLVHENRLGGNITNKTIEYANEVNADLIVIMTEQELQIGSFFLGKFAQQMVNHSVIPVLSIPPREDLIITEARL